MSFKKIIKTTKVRHLHEVLLEVVADETALYSVHMSKRNRTDYAGATGTITPEALLKLGSAYMIQPKMDGAYCHVHLDSAGCIQRISGRKGNDYGQNQTGTLVGQFVGYPGAVLVGELTAHTEAGNADAAAFGARRVHVFDMVFGFDSQPLKDLPYHQRRSKLCQMQAKVDAFGPGQSWRTSPEGVRDKKSGWFTKKTYRGTALTPIVAQTLPGNSSELWDRVRAKELEGLVAVAQNAPVGRRGSKRKCKQADTIDAIVIAIGKRAVECVYLDMRFVVHSANRSFCIGDVLEIKHNGYYRGGTTPRFPRIVRRRDDLLL